jgi:phosphomannomutase/phosphoglucomutase
MVGSLKRYFSTPEVRLETTEEKKWQLVAAAKEHFGSRYDTVDIDGVRVAFDHGWALLRASNTQPVVVLRAEGESETDLREIKGEIESFMASQRVDRMSWDA